MSIFVPHPSPLFPMLHQPLVKEVFKKNPIKTTNIYLLSLFHHTLPRARPRVRVRGGGVKGERSPANPASPMSNVASWAMGLQQKMVPSPTKKNEDSGGNKDGVPQSCIPWSDFFSCQTFRSVPVLFLAAHPFSGDTNV